MKKIYRLIQSLTLTMMILPACQSVQAADKASSSFKAASVNAPVLLASDDSMRLYEHSGCQLDTRQSKRLQTGLSEIQSVYAHTLGYAEKQEQPMKIQLFCSESDFHAYSMAAGLGSAISDTGFYSVETREMVIYNRYGLDDSLQTIYHEASHAILRSHPGPYPKWLNEGLAEYFEGGAPGDNSLVIAPQTPKENRLQNMLKNGRLPSLQSYLSLSPIDWQLRNSPEPVSSTLGWSLVYFLMETPTGQEQVRKLISLHQQDISPIAAIEKVYPGGVLKLEQDWHAWLATPRQDHIWSQNAKMAVVPASSY